MTASKRALDFEVESKRTRLAVHPRIESYQS